MSGMLLGLHDIVLVFVCVCYRRVAELMKGIWISDSGPFLPLSGQGSDLSFGEPVALSAHEQRGVWR